MIDNLNVVEYGVFGGAFFTLLILFVRYLKYERDLNKDRDKSHQELVMKVISDNKDEMRQQREAFTMSLHEITNKLVSIDMKLDSHISNSGSEALYNRRKTDKIEGDDINE